MKLTCKEKLKMVQNGVVILAIFFGAATYNSVKAILTGRKIS